MQHPGDFGGYQQYFFVPVLNYNTACVQENAVQIQGTCLAPCEAIKDHA